MLIYKPFAVIQSREAQAGKSQGEEMELVKILSYLLRMSRHKLSPWLMTLALIAGLFSGLGLTGWLAIISGVIAGNRDPRLLYGFIVLCVVVPASRLLTQSLFNYLATQAV